jgi:decaprenylphospho-beta-D-ribofuranose 2-oxidase
MPEAPLRGHGYADGTAVQGRVVELSGWGRRSRSAAEEIEPAGQAGLKDLTAAPYLARGLGRSFGDAGLPAPGHRALNSRRLDRVLAFNPFTGVVDAEAGVTLAALLALALPRGFFLPVAPGTLYVTLGGALASNVHGKNHHRAGSIERFVIEAEVFTPIGTLVCSETTRPDLFRATLGGYGLTGFIVRAKLRLKPVETAQVDALRLRAPDLGSMFALFAKHDDGFEYSAAWLDASARGRAQGRGVLTLGNHADPGGRGKAAELAAVPRRRLRVPFPMPGFALSRPFVSLGNGLCYRAARAGSSREDFESFFHPLDRIRDWNLLYGRRGFFQYQCALPDPRAEDGVAAVLDLAARQRLGAVRCVLKRCGDDRASLPFCRRGYTLALDVPCRGPATLRALDRLDELVIGCGGRVYLTKDARMSPAAFRAMYPEAPGFMEAVRRYNPEAGGGQGHYCDSRLARRLELWRI